MSVKTERNERDMKLCMGCMNEIEDHLSTCPYCGFNETALRQESYYLDPGTIIGGKYIVGRVLSYGGHTVSYMGMDAEKNRKVIVKEYLPSDFSTRSEGEKEVTIYSGDGQQQFEQGLTNFLNEANRIQHLQNINGIAKVYDCISENETGYVISEYVEGHTLKEILENGKRYSAEEAANFIRKILQGLVEVHRMDIVHCDISPETIMITNSGDIKLTDFGATRYVTTANSKSLSIILKRGFAPEEQYRSKGVRGPWTDVYALGAVMYYMITGTIPQESVERALSDDLKEPSKLGISIPKNIENALMNALNVYQKDRTPSAEAFLAELNSREVKRIKVKHQKNKIGKIPVWAKALVAGLACVVVAGGVYIVRNTRNSSTAISADTIVMADLTGKTEEEVQNYVESLKKQGLEVEYKEDGTVFNLDKPSDTVAKQTPKVGETLYDPQKESDIEENQTEQTQENKVEIHVSWNSQTQLHYSDLNNMGNAYAMAKALKIDTKDKDHFIPEEKGGENYYDLISIEMSGTVIKVADLRDDSNQSQELTYNKNDVKIHYYETDFLYWDNLPDFVGKKEKEIDKQPAYRYINETETKKIGRKSLKKSGVVDDQYYAISGDEENGYEKGEVVYQNIDPGETYDESNPTGDDTLKLKVIGNILDYNGKKSEDFVKELEEKFGNYGCMYSSGTTVNPGSETVTGVIVYDVSKDPTDRTNPVSYFTPSMDLFIEITVEPKADTPSTSRSVSDDDGSYSVPNSGYNSGYDNSGNYSTNSNYNNSSNNTGNDNFDDINNNGG